MNAVNKALEWITKLAFLNILWLCFTFLGVIIVGLFPSITATFTVAKKWVMGETDIPIFKTFWSAYKQDFLKSNFLGYILSGIGYILYLDFVFVTVSHVGNLLTIPFVLITIIYILTLFYVFPILVYYDMRLLQILKSAFFVMLLNPMTTIIMLIGTLGISYILWQFQGLVLFFSVSIFAVIIMMPAQRAFEKVNHKQQMYAQKNSN